MTAYKTGTCFVCTREDLRVLKDGNIGRHNSYSPNEQRFRRCSGYGKPSLEKLRAELKARDMKAGE